MRRDIGRWVSLSVALLCALPAGAGADQLKRITRLPFSELAPGTRRVEGSPYTRYSVTVQRLTKQGPQDIPTSGRYVDLPPGKVKITGTLSAHDGRKRATQRESGERVWPGDLVPLKVTGTVPRGESTASKSQLRGLKTVLELHTDLPAIKRAARQAGWRSDTLLQISSAVVKYSTDHGLTWQTHAPIGRIGDLEIPDVRPGQPLMYQATVKVIGRGLGGRQYLGEREVVFEGGR